MTEGYLWTGQYPEAQRVIDQGNNQSMELSDKFLDATWTKDINGKLASLKEETRDKLNNVDISDLETYKENIKDIIKDILKVDDKVEIVHEKEVKEEKNNIEEINYKLENGNTISTINNTTKTYRPYKIRKEKNNKQS